jgi:hypothetical protein
MYLPQSRPILGNTCTGTCTQIHRHSVLSWLCVYWAHCYKINSDQNKCFKHWMMSIIGVLRTNAHSCFNGLGELLEVRSIDICDILQCSHHQLKKNNKDIKHFSTLTFTSQKWILSTVILPVHHDTWPLVQYHQLERFSVSLPCPSLWKGTNDVFLSILHLLQILKSRYCKSKPVICRANQCDILCCMEVCSNSPHCFAKYTHYQTILQIKVVDTIITSLNY